MKTENKAQGTVKPRLNKKVDWLSVSRDSWKEKTKEAKDELKIKNLAVKRARESREDFKNKFAQEEQKLIEAKKLLVMKDLEIVELKKQLEGASKEVSNLKKKLSPM
jgi:chromosome segregation ATPase